jgi:hypothetical protein
MKTKMKQRSVVRMEGISAFLSSIVLFFISIAAIVILPTKNTYNNQVVRYYKFGCMGAIFIQPLPATFA